ncbi:TMEM175 family protein [Lentzea sp. NPDC051213]|uniref:TMEM175 family protein n=1 Tax=Lentzea sp. NPDC051213 TaxID=3364126 RepID=UPI0037B0BFC9
MKREPDRMVLFTDAVVAIAITLLVLPLVEIASVPGDLRPAELISHHWPQILSFLLSFAVIAQLWMTHHRIFENVRAYTRPLMGLNMLWVLTIVVLPFPTELVGSFGDDLFTQLFYVGTILVSSVLLSGMTLLAHKDELSPRMVLASITPTVLLLIALLLVPLVNYYGLLLLLFGQVISRFIGPREGGTAR